MLFKAINDFCFRDEYSDHNRYNLPNSMFSHHLFRISYSLRGIQFDRSIQLEDFRDIVKTMTRALIEELSIGQDAKLISQQMQDREFSEQFILRQVDWRAEMNLTPEQLISGVEKLSIESQYRPKLLNIAHSLNLENISESFKLKHKDIVEFMTAIQTLYYAGVALSDLEPLSAEHFKLILSKATFLISFITHKVASMNQLLALDFDKLKRVLDKSEPIQSLVKAEIIDFNTLTKLSLEKLTLVLNTLNVDEAKTILSSMKFEPEAATVAAAFYKSCPLETAFNASAPSASLRLAGYG